MTEEMPEAELTPEIALAVMRSADRILRHAQDLCARLDEEWVMSKAPPRIVGPLIDLGLDVQNFQALAFEPAVPGKTLPIEDLFGKVAELLEGKLKT